MIYYYLQATRGIMKEIITDKNQINTQELYNFLQENKATQKTLSCLNNTLIHASKLVVLKKGNKIKGFLSFVDDEEECLVHDFILDENSDISDAITLCEEVVDYARQKKFLYTEIFNYPSSITETLLKNNFCLSYTGMTFDKKKHKASVIIPPDGFKLTTNLKDIDIKGVNAIYDAVGWGARCNEMWAKILPKTSFGVQISHENTVVGFARITDDQKRGMIYDVCVLPSYQKKNIGSLLMEQICQYVSQKKLEFAGLVVVAENESARRFYQKFGFVNATPVLQLSRESIPQNSATCHKGFPHRMYQSISKERF